MTTTTPSTLTELRRLAEQATPGPWVMQKPGDNDPGAGTVFVDTHAYPDGPEPVIAETYPLGEADAAYIAAASPDVVLALLDRLAALEWALPIGLASNIAMLLEAEGLDGHDGDQCLKANDALLLWRDRARALLQEPFGSQPTGEQP